MADAHPGACVGKALKWPVPPPPPGGEPVFSRQLQAAVGEAITSTPRDFNMAVHTHLPSKPVPGMPPGTFGASNHTVNARPYIQDIIDACGKLSPAIEGRTWRAYGNIADMANTRSGALPDVGELLTAAPNQLVLGCAQCGSRSAELKCAGCRVVLYCDAGCQRAHWKSHKAACKETQARRKKFEEAGVEDATPHDLVEAVKQVADDRKAGLVDDAVADKRDVRLAMQAVMSSLMPDFAALYAAYCDRFDDTGCLIVECTGVKHFADSQRRVGAKNLYDDKFVQPNIVVSFLPYRQMQAMSGWDADRGRYGALKLDPAVKDPACAGWAATRAVPRALHAHLVSEAVARDSMFHALVMDRGP